MMGVGCRSWGVKAKRKKNKDKKLLSSIPGLNWENIFYSRLLSVNTRKIWPILLLWSSTIDKHIHHRNPRAKIGNAGNQTRVRRMLSAVLCRPVASPSQGIFVPNFVGGLTNFDKILLEKNQVAACTFFFFLVGAKKAFLRMERKKEFSAGIWSQILKVRLFDCWTESGC